MADTSPYRDSDADTGDANGAGADRGSIAGTPRWVKVFGIIALVIVLLFVILLLTRGPHRPGRHGGVGGSPTPPSSLIGHGEQQR